MKLGLGTAQFGMRYGVSNQRGKISADEIPAILALATKSGIDVLDTAPAYGDSESVIGQALANSGIFRIVTKAPGQWADQETLDIAGLLRGSLQQSLRRLRLDSVYGYLIHDLQGFSGSRSDRFIEALRDLKQEGLVGKVGVSVYTAADIEVILNRFVPDIVQVPVSIFDQRLLRSGHLRELKRRGVEIHVRSVFLQGLVLMQAENLTPYFSAVAGHLQRFSGFVADAGLTKLEAALAFIAQVPDIDVAIVGISGIHELEEITGVIERNASRGVWVPDAASWAINDEHVLNPALWPGAVTGRHR